MIENTDYHLATSEAKRLAEDFWSHVESDNAKLLATLGLNGKTSLMLTELSRYTEAFLGSQVHYTRKLSPGYASWLYIVDNKFRIVVDVQQIDLWSTGHASPPPAVQKIRSIIHELGHILLHGEQLKPTQAVGPVVSVSPVQEAAAWVFAMTFVGVLLGCYSEHSRSAHQCDDAPRVFL